MSVLLGAIAFGIWYLGDTSGSNWLGLGVLLVAMVMIVFDYQEYNTGKLNKDNKVTQIKGIKLTCCDPRETNLVKDQEYVLDYIMTTKNGNTFYYLQNDKRGYLGFRFIETYNEL